MTQYSSSSMTMSLINQFGSMLDIVPVPSSPLSPRGITQSKAQVDTTSHPTSKSAPQHRGIRKVRSEVKLGGGSLPTRHPRHSHLSLACQRKDSNSINNTKDTSVDNFLPTHSFTRLISTYSRSSTSTAAETVSTPSQSSHDLITPDWSIDPANEHSSFNFGISEAKPLSCEDIETLARIRAAYPDPNQIALAPAPIFQRPSERLSSPDQSMKEDEDEEEEERGSSLDKMARESDCLSPCPFANTAERDCPLCPGDTMDDGEVEKGNRSELDSRAQCQT